MISNYKQKEKIKENVYVVEDFKGNLLVAKIFPKTENRYTSVYSLENGTQISTYDHPKFFDYALKYAKKEIVIISPWIKWIVIEDKVTYIEEALKKGVKISFFYGMGNSRKDIDKDSKSFLKKIKREYPKLFNYSTTNQHDHSKIIIFDRDWMITTSFNWTSFKGDESMGDRRGERGSFINNRNEIDKILKDYIDVSTL